MVPFCGVEKMKIGSRVSYTDVNLWQYRGTVVDFDLGKHGGNCHIRWDSNGITSEECLDNLRLI